VIDVHRGKAALVVMRVPECKLLAAMRGRVAPPRPQRDGFLFRLRVSRIRSLGDAFAVWRRLLHRRRVDVSQQLPPGCAP
jgi:hypothetical protein